MSDKNHLSYFDTLNLQRSILISQILETYEDSLQSDSSAATFLLDEHENRVAIHYLMKAGEYSTAQNQLDSLPITGQDDIDFDSITNRAINLEANGQTWANLDSSGINELNTIVADSLPSSFMARAALAEALGYIYPPYLPIFSDSDETESARMKIPTPPANPFGNTQILIYPNPSANGFNFSFSGFTPSSSITIQIYNTLAILQFNTTLNSIINGNSLYVNTDNFPNGIYLCNIQVNGVQYEKQKLIVMKY